MNEYKKYYQRRSSALEILREGKRRIRGIPEKENCRVKK